MHAINAIIPIEGCKFGGLHRPPTIRAMTMVATAEARLAAADEGKVAR